MKQIFPDIDFGLTGMMGNREGGGGKVHKQKKLSFTEDEPIDLTPGCVSFRDLEITGWLSAVRFRSVTVNATRLQMR